jgi:hypothetical protein
MVPAHGRAGIVSNDDKLIADLAMQLLEIEEEIEEKQGDKKKLYEGARDEHGKKFAASLKLAVKLHRMDNDKRAEAEEIDAEAIRMLAVIERASRAPRATRVEIIEEFDAETGEIIEVPPADATQHAADSGSASSVPSDGAAAPIPEIPAGSPVSDDRQPAQVAAAASADHRLGEGPEAASREPKGPAKADAVESASEPTNVTPIRRNWKWTDPAHPDCLDPGTCGGFSNMALCGRCKEAAAALHVA